MRDDKWLFSKLDYVWDQYFSDIPQDNNVKIIWGRRARGRLGSIKQGEKVRGEHPETIITINSLFKDSKIPEYVVLGTHGFNSPIERRYSTPHAHGVVTNELKTRGLENIYRSQKRWLKENWRDYVLTAFPAKLQSRKRRKIILRWF
jgi:hypothetical protein